MQKYEICKGLYQLDGNGQCECQGCKEKTGWNRCWTSSCYEYRGVIYCSRCLREELQGDMIFMHDCTENKKIQYTNNHLEILALKRKERVLMKELIKAQCDELNLAHAYEKIFRD